MTERDEGCAECGSVLHVTGRCPDDYEPEETDNKERAWEHEEHGAFASTTKTS